MTGARPPLGRNSFDAAMSSTRTPAPNPFDLLIEAIAKRTAEILRHDLGLEPKRLLTVKEAADYISRSERSLRQMIAQGPVPVIREGRAVRLDRRVLDEWIDLRDSRDKMLFMSKRRQRGSGSLNFAGVSGGSAMSLPAAPIWESSHSPDKQVAENLLKQRIGEVAGGRDISPEKATIADLCALVLADYQLRKLRDLNTVEWRYEAHIKPAMGSLPASRFGPAKFVRTWLAAAPRKRQTPRSIGNWPSSAAVLASAFRRTRRW
ncbi:MAG TPA: helix-turn-helix domain-containing protein [Bryobacteraceae bacterium]|jgi:excisionase family DNA binding protein